VQLVPNKNLILTKEQLALWSKADKEAKADGKNPLTVLLELMEEEAK
jgi:hypothetical protein